jgi:hypothetical protein
MKKNKKLDKNHDNNIQMAQEVIRGMVKGGITPWQLSIGLHNALCFGDLHDNNSDFPIEESFLDSVMNSVETLCQSLKTVED